ncbi:hypothetical protein V865_004359 [Kwoniella europaea PYCC6329]|uniref:Uncharacterized protein n=1 Tax=Kwoniella europaea PYCC6329 TaxID=1423913 RepID=A0AAX4KL85_9TREE
MASSRLLRLRLRSNELLTKRFPNSVRPSTTFKYNGATPSGTSYTVLPTSIAGLISASGSISVSNRSFTTSSLVLKKKTTTNGGGVLEPSSEDYLDLPSPTQRVKFLNGIKKDYGDEYDNLTVPTTQLLDALRDMQSWRQLRSPKESML